MSVYGDYMASLPSRHVGVDGLEHVGKPSVWCYRCGGPAPDPPAEEKGDEAVEITLHRTERIPGGAFVGYSDDFPDRQFLIIPKPYCTKCGAPQLPDHPCGRNL